MEQKIIAKLGECDYVLWNENTIRNRDQFVSDVIEFSSNINDWQLYTILSDDNIVPEEFTKEVEYIRELIRLANPQTKRTKFDSWFNMISIQPLTTPTGTIFQINLTPLMAAEKIDISININKEEGKNGNNPNQIR